MCTCIRERATHLPPDGLIHGLRLKGFLHEHTELLGTKNFPFLIDCRMKLGCVTLGVTGAL